MKADKIPRAEIIAFYQGGAKVHATTTLTKVELETLLSVGLDENKKAVRIDTVNEDQAIADDSLTLLYDKMLFYTIFEKNESKIVSLDKKIEIVAG